MSSTAASPPESRRAWVLRQIRSRIAGGELAAGDRLVERDLSASFNLSRGPVREAIMVLEHEGLVVSHPYRGAVVAEIGQAEITEILVPIRLVIERVAFRTVAAAPPPPLLDHLTGLVLQMERACAPPPDIERLADLDVAFHEGVIAAAGHTQSLQIWRTLQPRIRAYFLRDAPQHSDPDELVNQHHALLNAVRAGDPDGAETALDAHVRNHFGTSRQ